MLEIRGLTKIYKGGRKAVDGLSLTVNDGDIYGFIGHNGAGKTTTIKAVVGVMDFDEGTILVNGVSVKDDPMAAKRAMAYIPDDPQLYEHLTGMQYIQFVADIYGVPSARREELVKRYAAELEITNALPELISTYSHGMKQKTAIIAALVHSPRLLVLDEPFVGLDPKASFTLKEIMRSMCADGCSIFFSTHVLEVAEKLCSRIAIIKNGALLVEGPTEAVKGDGSLESVFLELTEA